MIKFPFLISLISLFSFSVYKIEYDRLRLQILVSEDIRKGEGHHILARRQIDHFHVDVVAEREVIPRILELFTDTGLLGGAVAVFQHDRNVEADGFIRLVGEIKVDGLAVQSDPFSVKCHGRHPVGLVIVDVEAVTEIKPDGIVRIKALQVVADRDEAFLIFEIRVKCTVLLLSGRCRRDLEVFADREMVDFVIDPVGSFPFVGNRVDVGKIRRASAGASVALEPVRSADIRISVK